LDEVNHNLPVYKLLHELGDMARRDSLNISLTLEANPGVLSTKTKMLEVRDLFPAVTLED
jgi:hypothetical protein